MDVRASVGVAFPGSKYKLKSVSVVRTEGNEDEDVFVDNFYLGKSSLVNEEMSLGEIHHPVFLCVNRVTANSCGTDYIKIRIPGHPEVVFLRPLSVFVSHASEVGHAVYALYFTTSRYCFCNGESTTNYS